MTKYSFPPLVRKDCTVLILGSLPGEESIAKKQYYANERNACWKIIFNLFKEEYAVDYSIRCQHHPKLCGKIDSLECCLTR